MMQVGVTSLTGRQPCRMLRHSKVSLTMFVTGPISSIVLGRIVPRQVQTLRRQARSTSAK
jgi:hypothetical protein